MEIRSYSAQVTSIPNSNSPQATSTGTALQSRWGDPYKGETKPWNWASTSYII